MPLRFGDCLFDAGTRELRRKGRRCTLTPKGFRLLEVLLERRPRAVSKQEIHDLLWPGTYVSESSLARLAAEVREAIADPARRPRYLRTVHGFGYAFCGEVVEPLPESPRARPACRLVWGEREIPLPEGTHIAGRADDAVVKIASPKVSRQHARIVVTPNEATIEDLGSKNGTFVLGVRLENRRVLADGDEILIGPVLLTFRTGGQGSTEANVG